MSPNTEGRFQGPVLVGVSPSTGSPEALRWGAAEARFRKVELQAVMAWRLPRTQAGPGVSPPAFLPTRPDELQAEAEARLAAAVRTALGADHGVRCMAIRGSAAKVLLEASKAAQLLVLDSPRSGAAAALKPGLLAHQLSYRAHCPVVTVPPLQGEAQQLGRAMAAARPG